MLLFIICGFLGRLLNGLQELSIDRCPCEGKLLEDEPSKQDIEHLDNIANRVDPKILDAQSLTPLLEVIDEEVVDELWQQADAAIEQHVLVFCLLDHVRDVSGDQQDQLIQEIIRFDDRLKLVQEDQQSFAHAHLVDLILFDKFEWLWILRVIEPGYQIIDRLFLVNLLHVDLRNCPVFQFGHQQLERVGEIFIDFLKLLKGVLLRPAPIRLLRQFDRSRRLNNAISYNSIMNSLDMQLQRIVDLVSLATSTFVNFLFFDDLTLHPFTTLRFLHSFACLYYKQFIQRRVKMIGSIDKQSQGVEDELKKQAWVPTKLNWTTILYDGDIFIDAELYRKWDRNLKFEGQELLEKDLVRTRSNEPYFKKQSTKQLLKRITTFYCVQNKVNYQQGLLQVVIPFALLKRKDFQTRKCYAYFNSFMKKHFPRVLTQKTIENRKELPHAILAITLIQILLKYHQPLIYQTFKNHEIPLSMVVTQEILTVFAKNVQIPLVYEIFNFFMNKKDKNYLLYMCIALISLRKQQIFLHSEDDQLHTFVNKSLKDFRNKDDLLIFFEKSEEVEARTPKSFQILSKKIGFCDRSFFTYQDYDRMMKLEDLLIDFIMPVYREEIDEDPKRFLFILLSGQIPSKKYDFVRLNIVQQSGTILYNDKFLLRVPKDKILVVGYALQRQKQQKTKLVKLIKEINMQTNFGYKFMMFQDKLQSQKQCEIY